MALTVDTIESVLKARVGDYVRDMNKATDAYSRWRDAQRGEDRTTASVEQASQRRSRAKQREVESETAAAARLSAVVDRSIAKRNQEAAAAEKAADRIARAGSRSATSAQTRLMSTSSLGAAPGQGPVDTVNYALRDQIDLRNRLAATTIRGDQAASDGVQDQLRYLSLIKQYKQAGLDDTQAAIRAEQALEDVVQARAAAEARAANGTALSAGRIANGTRNLGRQFQDIGVGLVGGQGVFLVLAQQIPQVADAMTDFAPKAGLAGKAIKALQFFATPVGAIILALASAAAIFGSKLLFSADSADKAKNANLELVDALEKGRYATDAGRKAIDEYNAAQAREIKQTQLAKAVALDRAEADLKAAQAIREKVKAELESARVTAQANAGQGTGGLAGAAANVDLAGAEAAARQNQQDIERLQTTITNLRTEVGKDISERQSDPEKEITRRYEDQRLVLNKQLQERRASTAEIARQNTLLNKREQSELDVLRKRQQAERESTNNAGKANRLTLQSPVSGGRVTSGLGGRNAPTAGASTNHRGIDIAVPVGTPVRAGAEGVVISSGKLGGFGNAIVVDYGGGTIAKYGHLSQLIAQRGQRVSAGEVIGASGNTGRSTGPHLHYEVTTNGKTVDPRNPVRVGDQGRAEARDAAQEQRDAERIAEEQKRAAQEALENQRRFDDRVAQLNEQYAGFVADRNESLETQILREQAAVERAQISADQDAERDLIDGKINTAKRDELIRLNARNADAQKAQIQADGQREIDERDQRIAIAMLSLQQEALEAESQLLTGRQARYEAEKRLLELAQAEETAALERQIANGEITDATKARADLARSQGARGAGLDREFESPGQRYIREVGDVGKNINDSLEDVQVRGLQNLNDGLTDAITGAKSLGDAFKDVANQIIADLIRIAVQQAIIKPLAGALGLGGGEGGALASVFGSIFGGGRATGGPVSAGRVYRVNEHSTEGYASFSQPGRVVPLGEMASGRGGANITVQQTIQVDARNSVNPDGFERRILTMSAQQAQQAGTAAYGQAMRDAPNAVSRARRFGS